MASERRERDADGVLEGPGSLRLCAVTRAPLPPGDLIRFVAGPSGDIVPDLGRKLPGRGVWVSASRATVADAVRTRAFSRSLKRDVTAAPDLPDIVENLLVQRALGALSLANKAGVITSGFSQIEALLDKGSLVVLLHASDAAAGGVEKLDRKLRAIARDAGVSATIEAPFTIEQMSLAIGRPNVVHAALTKGGATENFLTEAGRLRRYRPARVAGDGLGDVVRP